MARSKKNRIPARGCKTIVKPKGIFDPNSFRYVFPKHGVAIIIGCKDGNWMPRKKWCRTKTTAHVKIKSRKKGARCPQGAESYTRA